MAARLSDVLTLLCTLRKTLCNAFWSWCRCARLWIFMGCSNVINVQRTSKEKNGKTIGINKQTERKKTGVDCSVISPCCALLKIFSRLTARTHHRTNGLKWEHAMPYSMEESTQSKIRNKKISNRPKNKEKFNWTQLETVFHSQYELHDWRTLTFVQRITHYIIYGLHKVYIS